MPGGTKANHAKPEDMGISWTRTQDLREVTAAQISLLLGKDFETLSAAIENDFFIICNEYRGNSISSVELHVNVVVSLGLLVNF